MIILKSETCKCHILISESEHYTLRIYMYMYIQKPIYSYSKAFITSILQHYTLFCAFSLSLPWQYTIPWVELWATGWDFLSLGNPMSSQIPMARVCHLRSVWDIGSCNVCWNIKYMWTGMHRTVNFFITRHFLITGINCTCNWLSYLIFTFD